MTPLSWLSCNGLLIVASAMKRLALNKQYPCQVYKIGERMIKG